jgi:Zn-dependent peptidase ImmA (M78 family)/transcriptional regulator with XRE-family HTH domain
MSACNNGHRKQATIDMPKVNPEILKWARETAGLSQADAVKKLGIGEARGVAAVDRLAALESGEVAPTRRQLLNMVQHYRRPLVTFYMAAPPRKGDRGQDFRNVPDRHTGGEALIDALVRDIRARQSMVREVLANEEEARPLPFIGSMEMNEGIGAVLASIRQTIRLDLAEFRAQATPESAFALLRSRVEAAGVFVLLVGNLGSHHSAIDVAAFRGFALADPIAPFIVVNDQDTKSAWSFTLLHELAHLWLGTTGVSGAFADAQIEQFCNAVAAGFLLPASELPLVGVDRHTAFGIATRLIGEFAEERHLSRTMVAYALFQAGFVDELTWLGLTRMFNLQWRQSRAAMRERQSDSGANYYVVRRHRLGSALLHFVSRNMSDGVLTPTKASKVLGVKPRSVAPLLSVAALPSGQAA